MNTTVLLNDRHLTYRLILIVCIHINANRRTTQQQEIDYIEEFNGQLFAYEIKWNEKRNVKFSKTFTEAYKSVNKIINKENFREFVMNA